MFAFWFLKQALGCAAMRSHANDTQETITRTGPRESHRPPKLSRLSWVSVLKTFWDLEPVFNFTYFLAFHGKKYSPDGLEFISITASH